MATDKIGGLDPLLSKLDRFQAALKGQALKVAMNRSGLIVAGEAQRRVTPGGGSGLNVRTGRLRNSIHHKLEEGGRNVRVIAGVHYARIHEYGGVTKAHEIRPRRGKVLAFMKGGESVVVRFVRHPGSRVPARPFLRPALAAKRDEVVRTVRSVYTGPLKIGGEFA